MFGSMAPIEGLWLNRKDRMDSQENVPQEQPQAAGDAPGAASSLGRQRLPFGLLSIDEILAHAKYRAEKRDNVDVDAVADLGLHYRPAEGGAEGGYFATVPVKNNDGNVVMKQLPLSPSAIRTACRLIKTTPAFFEQGDDPDFFPKNFQHIMDSPRKKERGLLLRHDGLKINAMLPRNYVVKDAAELLEDFIPALQSNMGDVRGVLALENTNGDYGSYRIVMGNNIMPSLTDEKGQFLMFNIATSETGLSPTKTSLGLYRTYCTNSAIRVQTLSAWNHLSNFDPFFDKAARTIRESGYLQDAYGRIFESLLREPLPFPAFDLIEAFKREKLISENHAESALIHARTDDVETQYDLFNVITRSAQDLPTITERESAEETAMRLFTEPGGVLEALRQAESGRRPGRRGKNGPIVG
jgi:hypothetical protein